MFCGRLQCKTRMLGSLKTIPHFAFSPVPPPMRALQVAAAPGEPALLVTHRGSRLYLFYLEMQTFTSMLKMFIC